MGFQAVFKFVKCWRALDVRETVPSSWVDLSLLSESNRIFAQQNAKSKSECY